MTDYSEKELMMFHALGIEKTMINEMYPVELYRYAAYRAFMCELTGSAVKSLISCCNALDKCEPYRRTPEFENLIQL